MTNKVFVRKIYNKPATQNIYQNTQKSGISKSQLNELENRNEFEQQNKERLT